MDALCRVNHVSCIINISKKKIPHRQSGPLRGSSSAYRALSQRGLLDVYDVHGSGEVSISLIVRLSCTWSTVTGDLVE